MLLRFMFSRVAGALALAGSLLLLHAQPAAAQCTPASPCVAGPQDVGTPLGGTYSYAAFLYGLSADGQVVVGGADTAAGFQHAAGRTASSPTSAR
jgi:uncharacterized membrane protein